MKYNYRVKLDGVYYEVGTDVPTPSDIKENTIVKEENTAESKVKKQRKSK